MFQTIILNQCQQELESWKRMLDHYKQENFHLKVRLVEMLNQGWEDQLLEAEKYQDDFISQDLVFQFLETEITEQDDLLHFASQTGCLLNSDLAKKQKKIRSDIWKAEQLFNELKKDFNQSADSIVDDARIF